MKLLASLAAVAIAVVAYADPPASSDGVSLVGGAPDAGADNIFGACPEPPAGDVAQQLDGGAWVLSPARAAYDACKLGACEEYAKNPPTVAFPDAGFQWAQSHSVIVAVAAGVVIGASYVVDREARHLPLLP